MYILVHLLTSRGQSSSYLMAEIDAVPANMVHANVSVSEMMSNRQSSIPDPA